MVDAPDVYLTAREFVGTPYLDHGRSIDTGLDCIGLPLLVARTLDLGIVSEERYSNSSPDGLIDAHINRKCEKYVLVPGVLCTFKIKGVPSHCGIISKYMDGLGLIHAWDIVGRVVEHRLTKNWRDRAIDCYKLPLVDYDRVRLRYGLHVIGNR